MNIVDYTNKFQEVEVKFDFYNRKVDSGLKFWDLVRSDVFYNIYLEISIENKAKIISSQSIKKSNSNHLYKRISNIINFYARTSFRKYKYLCFVCSRYKNEEGLNYDVASFDIVKILKKNSLIIESYSQKGPYLNSHIFNSGLLIERIMFFLNQKLFNSQKQKSFEISNILKQEFNVEIDFDSLICSKIEKYLIEFQYYTKLFKRLKPKAIFIVQNGLQKGLFAAANRLNIPSVELQHGLIGYIHPVYSYPKSIKEHQINTLPKIFIPFSSFWTKSINFPVHTIVPLGNSYFSRKIDKFIMDFEITFIFADIYTEEFIRLIDELLITGFNRRMCIKLHSNQYEQYFEIQNHFKQFRFIEIIRNEKNIESILAITKFILVIQSTVTYQALHNNVKVLIYRKMDYHTHEDVFENPLVRLFDTPNEIIKLLNEVNQDIIISNKYFEEFKLDQFEELLKTL